MELPVENLTMLNRMSLFIAMLATVLGLTTPAFATVVYTHDAGVWHMIGDVQPDTSDSACIFQTSLATAHVQINVFPKTGIPDHITMTLADPKGTWRPRQTIAVKTLFLGDNVDVTPFVLAATANNNEKITFRDLPSNFLSNFGHANSITLFREDPKETFIDLTGTSELLKGLEDCKMSLITPVAQSAPSPSPDVVAVKPDETPQPSEADDSRPSQYYTCQVTASHRESHSQFLEDDDYNEGGTISIDVDFSNQRLNNYPAQFSASSVYAASGRSFVQSDGTVAPAVLIYVFDMRNGTFEKQYYTHQATHTHSGTCTLDSN
jgi:hypothetical protein